MRIVPIVVAASLLGGGFTVLSAQTASACGWVDPDCYARVKVEGRKLNVTMVDKGPHYDTSIYTPPPPREKVQQWRRDYWFDYPRNAEASQDWLGNLFRGGADNPNIGARAKARDAAGRKTDLYDQYGLRPQQAAPQADGCSFGTECWKPSW